MIKYMLILFENPSDYAAMTPQQKRELVKEYRQWARQMGKEGEGKFVGGEKLADEGGKLITGKGSRAVVTDGPFAEAKVVLGWIFIIIAASYEEAVAIARSCPHAKYSFAIHVRRIDDQE